MAHIELDLWYDATCTNARECRGELTSNSDSLDRLDIVPGNCALPKSNRQDTPQQVHSFLHTHAAQQPTQANINTDKARSLLDLGQFQIINFDNAKALRINNLLIQNVALQWHLIRVWRIGCYLCLIHSQMNPWFF